MVIIKSYDNDNFNDDSEILIMIIIIKIIIIVVTIMMMIKKITLIIAVVIMIIKSPFQPGDFSSGSTTVFYKFFSSKKYSAFLVPLYKAVVGFLPVSNRETLANFKACVRYFLKSLYTSG